VSFHDDNLPEENFDPDLMERELESFADENFLWQNGIEPDPFDFAD
jgi:hypothetical protein